jgi:asparagine synthase (glutamine-hydrolysing)
MSGFAGIINFDGAPVDRALLESMTDALVYRGPDARAIWVDGAAGFGHTLFRTTFEAAHEQQPRSFDGQITLVADARIDARDDLIPQLRAQGRDVSHDAPDGDLILHAYHVWGEDCAAHLLGDFAFAIWDSPRQRLLCARDHFGVRGLYYARVGQTLIICNDLGPLLQHPALPRTLNEQAVGDFLLFGSYAWLDKAATVYAAIQKVPPAHLLIGSPEGVATRPYWQFPLDVPLLRYRREADYLEHFRTVLRTAVKDRLRTDRVVISMSGGLDSPSVAALATELQRAGESPGQLRALTLVYDTVHPEEERYYAGQVAQHLDLPIEFMVCDEFRLLDPQIAAPELVENISPALTLASRRRIAHLGRVELTGRSADNIMAPSPTPITRAIRLMGVGRGLAATFRMWQVTGRRPALGSGLVARWHAAPAPEPASEVQLPAWLNPDFVARLDLAERRRTFLNWQPEPLNPRHPKLHLWAVFPDWSASYPHYPDHVDYAPAEPVDPYMDVRVIRLLLALPPIPWFYKKYLLRQAMQSYLPGEVLARPKTPLGTLPTSLLKQPESAWVDSWEPHPDLEPFVQRAAIPPLYRNDDSESNPINIRPLMLNLWLAGRNGTIP